MNDILKKDPKCIFKQNRESVPKNGKLLEAQCIPEIKTVQCCTICIFFKY